MRGSTQLRWTAHGTDSALLPLRSVKSGLWAISRRRGWPILVAFLIGCTGAALAACDQGTDPSTAWEHGRGFGKTFSKNISFDCPPGQLSATDNASTSCKSVSPVDTTGDGVADGLDVNEDLIPELVYLPGAAPQETRIDVDGDGRADYFLVTNAAGQFYLSTGPLGTGVEVRLFLNGAGTVTGLDSNSDQSPDDLRVAAVLSDANPPTLTASLPHGTYRSGPLITLFCQDNAACNGIVYTLDGTTPAFGTHGTTVSGNTAQVNLVAQGSGTVTLQALARDSAGKVSPLLSQAYSIAPATCTAVVTLDPGIEQDVTRGSLAALDASASTATGGTIAGFTWVQLPIGGAVDVTSQVGTLTGATATFTAPQV